MFQIASVQQRPTLLRLHRRYTPALQYTNDDSFQTIIRSPRQRRHTHRLTKDWINRHIDHPVSATYAFNCSTVSRFMTMQLHQRPATSTKTIFIFSICCRQELIDSRVYAVQPTHLSTLQRLYRLLYNSSDLQPCKYYVYDSLNKGLPFKILPSYFCHPLSSQSSIT